MAKKKQRIPESLKLIDLDAIYICDMIVRDTQETEKAEVKFEVDQEGIGYNIIPVDRERYENKYFYDRYVEFLLYRKYFVKKEEYIAE